MQNTTSIERDHEIVNNGFSNLVKTPGLFLCIVCENSKHEPTRFAVHMRHGSPGGQFWRNGGAINKFKDVSEARKLVDRLAGLIDAHKSFPVYHIDY